MGLIRTQTSPSSVKFTATSLSGANPVKYLEIDDTGFRKVILGAFNMPNSIGITYPFLPQVESLFKPGSAFYTRLQNRLLKGECGHPSPLGLTLDQYLIRLQKIEPLLVAVFIKAIELTEVKTDRGVPVVLVWGWVKASGPYGPSLEKQLAEKEENVSFSLRSLTDPAVINGKLCKIVWNMVTYDLVSQGGISLAEKSNTIALSNAAQDVKISIECGLEEISDDVYFTPEHFDLAIRSMSMAGLEDDSKSLAMIRDGLGWTKVEVTDLRAIHWQKKK